MKLHILHFIIALATAMVASAADVTFAGYRNQPVSVEPDSRSGLDGVYVVETVEGLSVTFNSPDQLTWWRYNSQGGAYAEQINNIEHSGTSWTLTNPESNMGYLIEIDGGSHYYFWIADYSVTPFEGGSLDIAATDCGTTELVFNGKADRMTYYSITGRAIEINREITLSYNTEQYDSETGRFVTTPITDTRASLGANISVQAPYATTTFTVEGDRFLRQWGRPVSTTSQTCQPVAVDGYATATQHYRDSDNEQGSADNEELGGSAPVDITFSAAVTEGAIFTEWQMARDLEFDVIDYRSNDLEFHYTFQEMGTIFVRFMAANADGTCDYISDTFTIFIGESDLICPNAFSPGASEGVNDIWKVSYKSIVKFECHIFNKWGEKMAEFTDPSQGWDGKYRGKVVPAGVYYYVIKALGADGRKYNRSGDINIVGYN